MVLDTVVKEWFCNCNWPRPYEEVQGTVPCDEWVSEAPPIPVPYRCFAALQASISPAIHPSSLHTYRTDRT